jgi:hypothetical protein
MKNLFKRKMNLRGDWSDTAELVITQATELTIAEIVRATDCERITIEKQIYDLSRLVAENIWNQAAHRFNSQRDGPLGPINGSGLFNSWSSSTKFTIPGEEFSEVIDARLEYHGLISQSKDSRSEK